MAARPGLVESESWSVQPAESACAGSSNTDQYVLKEIWQYLRRTRWETLGKICQDHVPFIL